MSKNFQETGSKSIILDKNHFGQDFQWGVAASAYQTEGGYCLDDKGLSIWDVFANKKGKIYQGQTGNEACNFYQQFGEDLQLMATMNIPNFRFSLSWPRIIPSGYGKPNSKGI